MFLLESAALPGENDACGRVPIPPSSFSVPARVAVCIRVAKIASPSPPPSSFFLSLWVEKAAGISQNNLGEVTGLQINCPGWLWPLFSAFG